VSRRFFAVLALVALAIGAAVLIYRGPGQPFVRGHVGDAAATMLVYALLGFAWRARIGVRAATTFAIAAAIEVGQTLWQVDGAAGELLLGATFDVWDLVAYAVGTAIAASAEIGMGRTRVVFDPHAKRRDRRAAGRVHEYAIDARTDTTTDA